MNWEARPRAGMEALFPGRFPQDELDCNAARLVATLRATHGLTRLPRFGTLNKAHCP